MKRLILIIGIISSFYCYAQRVEILMDFTTKDIGPLPSLNPFSSLWILHTKDTVYAIDPNINKVFMGPGLNFNTSPMYDYFIDSLTSNVSGRIVKYYIDEKNSIIKAIVDSVKPSFYVYAMDPLAKIILVPDTDRKSFVLKKIKYNDKYELTEEELVAKMPFPDSTNKNWQIRFMAHLKNWWIWRIANWYYEKGSYLICLNSQKNFIKILPFIPGGPWIKGYCIEWERFEINGYGIIRMRLDEKEDDINAEVIDTIRTYGFPLGGNNEYTLWGVIENSRVLLQIIDKNKNKINILELPNPTGDKTRAGTLSFSLVPVDNVIVNIFFTHDDFWTTDNKIIKISFPYTSVSNSNSSKPISNFNLYQNYPNPFNPSTTIEFDIPERTNVKLVVYDILGREVETLIDKELEPGKYKINFTATNLPSGVYFYTLRTPKFTKTNKMLLIK